MFRTGDKIENRNIIIILLVIIVILAAGLGVMILNHSNAKEATKIKITSDKTQYEEDEKISIILTDLNKTVISKEKVDISIINKNGKVVINKTVKTNSKGKAKIDFDIKKGKYTVNAVYGGNENYTANNTTQKLIIKEKVAEQSSSGSSASQGWITECPGGDTGYRIVIYHDGNGHKYVTRYSADGSAYEDGIAYDEDALITS